MKLSVAHDKDFLIKNTLAEHGRLASLRELHMNNRNKFPTAETRASRFRWPCLTVPKDKEKISWTQKIHLKYSEIIKNLQSHHQATTSFVLKQKQVGFLHYRELSSRSRERVLFFLSTLVGTALFFILFECIYAVFSRSNGGNPETGFVLSYTGAYFLSIIWQHMLNQKIVGLGTNLGYCVSLLHTFLIYSLSYFVAACVGTLILKNSSLHPRSVTYITLPLSGCINYYFLAFCLDSSSPPRTKGTNPSPSLSLAPLPSEPSSQSLSPSASTAAATAFVAINIKSSCPSVAHAIAKPSLHEPALAVPLAQGLHAHTGTGDIKDV